MQFSFKMHAVTTMSSKQKLVTYEIDNNSFKTNHQPFCMRHFLLRFITSLGSLIILNSIRCNYLKKGYLFSITKKKLKISSKPLS